MIVCTHNDKDHANGVLEFLDAGCSAGECWLPATWIGVLRRLLNPTDSGKNELPAMVDELFEDDDKLEPVCGWGRWGDHGSQFIT